MDISRCDDDGAVKLAEKSVKSRRNSNFPSDTLQVMCPLLFFSGFGRILDNTEIACQTLNISSLVEREKLRWSLARSKRNLTRKFDRRIGGFMWSKLSVLNTVKNYLPTLDTATTGLSRAASGLTLWLIERIFFVKSNYWSSKPVRWRHCSRRALCVQLVFGQHSIDFSQFARFSETERERLKFLRLRDLHFTLAQRLDDH